jgi:DNA-binding NarL/FixJ family response regulator
MKKIRVTIIAGAAEEYPGCADILANCPEIEVVAGPAGLDQAGAWSAISSTDVLILDEVMLERGWADCVRTIYRHHPVIKLLLILDNSSENRALDALAMGIGGVIERASLVSMLRKAIPALYAGETWVSRRLVQVLRMQLVHLDEETFPGFSALTRSIYERLN